MQHLPLRSVQSCRAAVLWELLHGLRGACSFWGASHPWYFAAGPKELHPARAGQSDGLDQPAWEESSAESHTGLVCCFGSFLTSA